MHTQPSYLGVALLVVIFAGTMACGEAATDPIATVEGSVLGASVPASLDASGGAHSESSWIVFQSARSGQGDLYAVDPASGETKRIFGTDLGEGGVRYDAARGRLVHQRFEEDPEQVVLATGADALFVDPNGDTPPSWSPKGGRIVYVASRGGQEDLYLADADGTHEVQLTNDAEVDRYPVWSPDGRHVAFARKAETGWDVFKMSPDPSATPVRLTQLGEYVGHLDWSPDGSQIAFDRLYDGQTEIAVLDLESGEIRRLTERAGNDMVPAWSPDGAQIAFAGEPEGSGNWDLWTVDVSTLEISRLTTEEGYDGRPVYVPASVLER